MKMGLDLGSRFVKIAFRTADARLQLKKIAAVEFFKHFTLHDKFGSWSVDWPKMDILQPPTQILATGYGRHHTALKDAKTIPELQAHALGLTAWSDKPIIVLDIGGQDTKALRVERGRIFDFQMNDKCAAGAGRFLENMAGILDMPLPDLFACHQNPAELSTTCAIYAESEIIAKLAEGVSSASLAAGVNLALFQRILPLFSQWEEKRIVLSGGGAYNTALVYFLEQNGYQVIRPSHPPEFSGALGCLSQIEEIYYA